jgi:hypothetical protein
LTHDGAASEQIKNRVRQASGIDNNVSEREMKHVVLWKASALPFLGLNRV